MTRFDRFVSDGNGQETRQSRFDRYVAPDGMNEIESLLSGGADALTFGFGDELQGLAFGDQAKDAARRRQELARADHPGWFTGGQVAGSLIGGGAIGAGVRGAATGTRLALAASRMGPLSRIGAASLAAGAGGSLYGAGDAGEEMRLQGAVNNFLPSAIGGGAFQGLGEVGGHVFRNVARSMSPEASAGRMLAESLERFGKTGDDIPRMLSDAPANATVADVVPGYMQLVRGAGVRPSRERDALRDFYDARNNAMGGNAADDAWRTLNGTGRQDPAAAIERLQDVQRRTAAPLFAEVHAGRLPAGAAPQAIRELMRRNPDLFGPAEQAARASMLRATGVVNPTQEALEQSPLYWHRLLENVQAEVGAVMRQSRGPNPLQGPRGSRVAEIGQDASRFNVMVRRMLGPKFRQAMDTYSGAARGQEAVQRGYEAVSTNLNSMEMGELTRWLARATSGEKELMRTGALGRLTDMLENADTGTGRGDVLRSIMRNAGQRRVLERIFGGEQRFTQLMRRLDDQHQLFRNSVDAGIGVNSHTAPLIAAHQSQQALTNPGSAGWRDMVVKMLTREGTDRFDESVSNQVLANAQINANQAAGEIAQVGGFERWAQGRGLLSRAIRERMRMQKQRPSDLANALGVGLYYPVGGTAAAEYGMGY